MNERGQRGRHFSSASYFLPAFSGIIFTSLVFTACSPSNSFTGNSPSKRKLEEKTSENVEKQTPGSENIGGAGNVAPGDIAGLAKICGEKTLKMRTVVINIPSNSGAKCPFGQGDNLPTIGGQITARIERDFPLDIPKTHKVCSMKADAANQLMRYDDHLFLTLNGTVLLASTTEANKFTNGAGGLKRFEWDKIKGGNSSDSPSYCGPGISCSLPRTEVQGQFQFAISDDASAKIFAPLIGSDLKFGLVLTGDDNPESDCQLNTSLQINVHYGYLE
jgi:hypothetical protein